MQVLQQTKKKHAIDYAEKAAATRHSVRQYGSQKPI